jgi:hypothetical protein
MIMQLPPIVTVTSNVFKVQTTIWAHTNTNTNTNTTYIAYVLSNVYNLNSKMCIIFLLFYIFFIMFLLLLNIFTKLHYNSFDLMIKFINLIMKANLA